MGPAAPAPMEECGLGTDNGPVAGAMGCCFLPASMFCSWIFILNPGLAVHQRPAALRQGNPRLHRSSP
jgi:hypothetical protein